MASQHEDQDPSFGELYEGAKSSREGARRVNLPVAAGIALGGILAVLIIFGMMSKMLSAKFGGAPQVAAATDRLGPSEQPGNSLRHTEFPGGEGGNGNDAGYAGAESALDPRLKEVLQAQYAVYLEALHADPQYMGGQRGATAASREAALDPYQLGSQLASLRAEVARLEDGGANVAPTVAAVAAVDAWQTDNLLDPLRIDQVQSMQPPRWALLPGTQIPAVLMTDYDSSQPSLVVAMTRRPVYSQDRGHVLIPAGTVLLGESMSALPASARAGYGRIEAMVFPDERVFSVPSWQPTSSLGAAGIPAKVRFPLWRGFKAATLLGLTSGVFAAAADTNEATFGRVDPGEAVASEVAQEYQRLAGRVLNRLVNLPAVAEAKAGTRFLVLVQHTLDMQAPWGRVAG